MGKIKFLTLGLLLGISISACTSLGFIYKYYVYDFEAQTLRGPEAKDDLDAKICSYSSNEYQCIVMKHDEFFTFKADYEKRGIRIKELEKKCGRNN